MTPKINILFPIEIQNRELDFRLMFAGVCARPDWRIWIGSMSTLMRLVQANRGGLYVGKHILRGRFPDADQSRYRVLKQQGFSYIHLDEEGAVHPGNEDEWKRIFAYTLDPRFLDADDHVATWGKWQRDFYRAYQPTPACCENIVTTGHPRFDLYKPQYREYFNDEAQNYRERYGDFVLMNTNFSFVNRPRGTDNAFSSRYFYDPANPQKRLNQVQRWHHISQIFSGFIQLATRLSVEFPKLNIVLRPHPSEDVTIYHQIFEQVPNVHIVHEGSVGAWLLASRCLIHDGCTTALEAHFCGTPIINYKSQVAPQYDKFLPNMFGFQARDEAAAIKHLSEILQRSTPASATDVCIPEDQRALDLLENFQSSAMENLSALVAKKAATLEAREYSVPSSKTSISRVMKNRLGLSKSPQNSGKLPEFRGFESEDLDSKIATISRLVGKDLRHRLHNRELLTIEL